MKIVWVVLFRATCKQSLAALVALAIASTAPATANTVGKYVALGDSYAAVGTITANAGGQPGCFRSTDNYPAGLALRLGIREFSDVTCLGADTADMTKPQRTRTGPMPAQFDALTPDTDLVTITLGGNDIDFLGIAETCGLLDISNPPGSPCKDHYTTGGVDQLGAAIVATAPKLAAVLDGIRHRAPHARIIVVGYPHLLPPTGSCWPTVPLTPGDAAYITSVQQRLNTMIRDAAKARRATYVEVRHDGHDACQPPGVRWIEPVVPGAPAVPLHPNAAGQAATAALVATAMSTAR